jgi:molybdenum cofactor biosynthesis enzyme
MKFWITLVALVALVSAVLLLAAKAAYLRHHNAVLNITISADSDALTIERTGTITLHVMVKKADEELDIANLDVAPSHEGYHEEWDDEGKLWIFTPEDADAGETK